MKQSRQEDGDNIVIWPKDTAIAHPWVYFNICGKVLALSDEFSRKIKSFRKVLNKAAMKRMPNEEADVKTEMLNIDINNHLEKISGHAISVINSAYYRQHDDDVPEKYIDGTV